jgi:hypothetical protein
MYFPDVLSNAWVLPNGTHKSTSMMSFLMCSFLLSARFEQAHEAASAKIRRASTSYPVPKNIQELMDCPMKSIDFTFTDPVGALVRLLLMSPLGADARNLAFFPEEGPLADYCNGDRMKRIHAALPPGSVALTCTLFFDEINRDQKGFNTGDGGIVVGGFFRSHVRESTDAKVSFCTFPKVTFGQKNCATTNWRQFTDVLQDFTTAAGPWCDCRYNHHFNAHSRPFKIYFFMCFKNSNLKCYFKMYFKMSF